MMKFIGLVALLLMGSLGPATTAPAQPPRELTVSAAASLVNVLQEVDEHFPAKINLNLGASGALQRQIEQGAPADVFVAAASAPMDHLQKLGLIVASTRRDVAGNQLVLVVPATSQLHLKNFRDLTLGRVTRFAMGEPHAVPAGAYARAVLRHLHIDGAVTSKAVLCTDVREVLTQVELGNVDAGMVYRTDAQSTRLVRVVATAPEAWHAPIVYPAAVVTASPSRSLALAYVKFLNGKVAQKIFARYGFSVR